MKIPKEVTPKKTAIVTGAATGIGLAVCKLLVQNGILVILNDIDTDIGKKAVANVNAIVPDSCFGIFGDCSDIEFIDTLVSKTIEKYGKIDYLVANAGITLFGDFMSFSPFDFDKIMALNLKGTFFLVQKVAYQIQKQKSDGSIILMSSVVGSQAHKNLTAYAMTKAALQMMAKNLVLELSPLNIRINTVSPGATLTERTLSDENYQKTWSEITPLGKPATVEDIAEAVLFIMNAKHLTGQTLTVDGGWTSVSPQPE